MILSRTLNIRGIALLAPICLLLAACGNDSPRRSGDASEANIAEQTPLPEGERILGTPPLHWELTLRSLNPELRLLEFRPPLPEPAAPIEPTAESEAAASEAALAPQRPRLKFETFISQPLPDPLQTLGDIAHALEERCEGFDYFNTFVGSENNYHTAVALMVCHKHQLSGQGLVRMSKAIRGNDHFYVITRDEPTAPLSSSDMAALSADRPDAQALATVVGALSLYMRSVRLCDDNLPAHPCRQPTPKR